MTAIRHIYLCRHGQSRKQSGEDHEPWNPALSRLGRQQAACLGERLRGVPFDRIIISPLRRTYETWTLSGLRAPDMSFDSRVLERCSEYPAVYGRIRQDAPIVAESVRADEHDAWLQPHQLRLQHLLAELGSDPEREEHVLIIAHWEINSCFMQEFLGLDSDVWWRRQFRGTNCAVSKLEQWPNRDRSCSYWNDSAHLGDLVVADAS